MSDTDFESTWQVKLMGPLRVRSETLHADKAYDVPRRHAYLKQRGILDRIAPRGIESSERLGRSRQVAERTIAWLLQLRRLAIHWERRDDIHQALLDFDCAIFCYRLLSQPVMLGALNRMRRSFSSDPDCGGSRLRLSLIHI